MSIVLFLSAKRIFKIKTKITEFEPVCTSSWHGPGTRHIVFDSVFVLGLIAAETSLVSASPFPKIHQHSSQLGIVVDIHLCLEKNSNQVWQNKWNPTVGYASMEKNLEIKCCLQSSLERWINSVSLWTILIQGTVCVSLDFKRELERRPFSVLYVAVNAAALSLKG